MEDADPLWAVACDIPWVSGLVVGKLQQSSGSFWWADGETDHSISGCDVQNYCWILSPTVL